MVEPMVLLQNNGANHFTDAALSARVGVGPSNAVGWGTAFFDCDNDGWLDLFLATTEFRLYEGGMHFSYPNYLFQNNGDGSFTNISAQSWVEQAHPSMGFAYADYDQDGRVDFVLGNWNEGYTLYHNESSAAQDNNRLTVRLIGGGPVNRDAIGSRVYLTTSDGRVQLREVNSGSSLGAGNDTALYFGLGQAVIPGRFVTGLSPVGSCWRHWVWSFCPCSGASNLQPDCPGFNHTSIDSSKISITIGPKLISSPYFWLFRIQLT
jgi:hypothetical protein